MSKRPTDHLIPAAKKRSNDRQRTKDDVSDSDEEAEEPGTWQKATEDVLKQRKIVKARRPGTAAVMPSAPASSPAAGAPAAGNPFSGKTTSSNPFAGVNLLAPKAMEHAPAQDVPAAAVDKEEAPAEQAVETNDTKPAEGAPASHAAKSEARTAETAVEQAATPADSIEPTAATVDPTSAAAPAASTAPAFSSFSTSTAKPFAAAAGSSSGFAFGAAATGNGTGFGALAGASTSGAFSFGVSSSSAPAAGDTAAGSTFSFKPAASSAFTFSSAPSTGTFPSVQSIFGSAGTAAATTVPIFGATSSASPSNDAAAALPLPEDEEVVTGEEDEETPFAGDGVLFGLDNGQWKERGRGEMRVKVAPSGQARMVMRQKGNLRLLLNANLYAEMALNIMDGGKGATFAVINAAAQADQEDVKPVLSTFAFRIKSESKLEEFVHIVNMSKGGRVQNGAPAASADATNNV